MTPETYHASTGLSNSGLKDLAVSNLRYYANWLDPNRQPRKETPEMALGSAIHCALLEPDEFDKRYAQPLNETDYEGLLVTDDDLKAHLKSINIKPEGKRKEDRIRQVQAATPTAPIWDVMLDEHARNNAGKTIFKPEDWMRICGAASALSNEPRVSQLLKGARTEVSLTATDPETGVLLKARLDAIMHTGMATVDFKTFSVQRGKTVDKAVADAIWYEGYYRQAWLYTYMRDLTENNPYASPDFVIVFVESEPPFETRIKVLRGKTAGNPNLYWLRARHEVRTLINKYAECVALYGLDQPWRSAQEVTPLEDADIPQLGWS